MKAREIAGKVVHDVLTSDTFSNRRLSELLDQSKLESRDRNLCAELVYGTLRWSIPLEDSLRSAMDKPGKIPPRVLAHWLVAAYQLQHLSETIPAHAVVNEAVGFVKRLAPGLAGLTNAILRKLGSPKHQMLAFAKAKPTDVARAFGLPEELVACIFESLPEGEWEAAINAMNARPTTFLRAYGKARTDSLTPHAFVPGAFSTGEQGSAATGKGGIASAPLASLLRGSHFVVQDPASQIAALLLAPKVGDRVIDMCSAPGMKALILSSLTGGNVMAVEINPAKKERMIANRKRLGQKFDIQIRDATKLGEDEALRGTFDAVLLDAPCSGLGTVRRHSEIRRRFAESVLPSAPVMPATAGIHTNPPTSFDDTLALQRKLLTSAAALVKPGGSLVYSVCSPLKQEGSEQIAWFLKNHNDFKVDDPKSVLAWLPENAVTQANHVVLWPHRHDCDAFFAARLTR